MASVDAADTIKIPRTQAYSEHMARAFQQLRLDDELTNFTIHTATRSFRCHQAILAGVSPVLKAMLTSSMSEASKQEVRLEHISSDIMEIVLTYIYTGETCIPQEKLLPIVEASDYLELLELKEYCLKEAVRVCKPSNAFSLFKLVDALNIDALKSLCTNILSSSLAEVSKFEEFHRLQATELGNFLNSAKELDVNPDGLLEATLDWIEYKPDERITSMEELVQNINLPECTVECLERVIAKHKTLIRNCPQVHILFRNHIVQAPKHGTARKKPRGRCSAKSTTIVFGGDEIEVCWELKEQRLVEVCRIPGLYSGFAVCATPTGFAVTGGGEDRRRCSIFHMTARMWQDLQSLECQRSGHGANCIDEKLWVFGGYVSDSLSSSVQFLKLYGGEWMDGPNIPQAVNCPQVASSDSGIFLLDTLSDTLFLLEIETNVWSTRAPMPPQCNWGRMVSVDDQLLVAGGDYHGTSWMLLHYSIPTDTWTIGNPPSLCHRFGAMFYDNRKLCLLGGDDEDRVEEYSMDTGSWSMSDFSVPDYLGDLHALVVYS